MTLCKVYFTLFVETMTKFRLLLRELRQANDLSQEELARALQVSRQSIISLERGEYLPSMPVLISLIEFFDCPIDQLIDGVSPKNNQQLVSQTEKGGEKQMQLTPWSPFQAIDHMQEEMNSMIERTFGRGDWSNALQATTGAMNIHESEKEYEIEFQVPGYTEKEVTIEMTENTLTVSGAKEEEKKEGRDVVRREWQHSQFRRSIRFTHPIKEDKVEAKMENGTLKIIAPKIEPTKPKVKKIEVKRA